MRSAVKQAGVVAAILMVVAAIQIATPAAAEATTVTGTRTTTMPHCGGLVFVQANFDTNTVTSFWVENPSLLNPPVCGQAAVAICTESSPVGPFTVFPFFQTSTVTCPTGESLGFAGSLVQHIQ